MPLELFKLAPQRQAITILRDNRVSMICAVVVDYNEFPCEIASYPHRGKRIEGPPQRFRAIEGTDGNRYEHGSG
jgi:hypothetical protein